MTEPDAETGGERTASEPPPKVGSLPPPNPPPRRGSIPSIPPAPAPSPGERAPADGGPSPAAPKRSRRGLIALGLGAAVLTVAAGAALKLYLAPAPPLPVSLGKLPEELTTVRSVDASVHAQWLEMRPEDVPDEARWSYYAEQLCGGRDLFHDLLDTEHAGGADKLADLVADKDEAKATLSCGKAIAQSVGKKGRLYQLTLHVGHAPHDVFVSRFDAKDLPETTKLLKSAKAPDHLEDARCRHPKGEVEPLKEGAPVDHDDLEGETPKHHRDPDADCAWAVAKIEHEPLWVQGDMRGLKAFGEDYSPEGKNKIDDAELFQKVLDGLSGSSIEAGHGDDGRGLRPLGLVSDEEIRDKTVRILRDVKVWGATSELEGPFERLHLEYHAAKESDAKDAAETLERYIKELKRELKDEDAAALDLEESRSGAAETPVDAKRPSEDAPVEGRTKLRAALRKLRWKALDDAKIDRSGVVVTVDVTEKPEKADEQAWKAYADANKARAKNAAAIIDALIAGSDASEDDEKALSVKLHATLHPPESVPLDGFGDLRIPGGGRCFAVDSTTQTCAFPKWDKPTALEKLKTQITKAGFSVTPGASDATFVAKKGEATVVVDIYATPSAGSHVTLSMAPAKPAP